LEGAKHRDLEDTLLIWLGQVNAKMEQQVMKLQGSREIIGQQMSVTNFVPKSCYVFCFKSEVQYNKDDYLAV
jgi:hypothetical protein